MKDTILAISGRPGLYRLVAQGRGNIIVEAIDETKKRFSVGTRDRVTSLNDVSMYSDDDDVSLMQIFATISEKNQGKPSPLAHNKATDAELRKFMEEALPTYDRDRVHVSDMKKLLQWYNILAKNGYKDFSDETEAEQDETEAEQK